MRLWCICASPPSPSSRLHRAAALGQLLAAGRQFGQRLWAVEGCQGVGRHLAQRLVADGEIVVDVPAKLSARTRVFSTGQGRKTDATDRPDPADRGVGSLTR